MMGATGFTGFIYGAAAVQSHPARNPFAEEAPERTWPYDFGVLDFLGAIIRNHAAKGMGPLVELVLPRSIEYLFVREAARFMDSRNFGRGEPVSRPTMFAGVRLVFE